MVYSDQHTNQSKTTNHEYKLWTIIVPHILNGYYLSMLYISLFSRVLSMSLFNFETCDFNVFYAFVVVFRSCRILF